MNRKYNYSDFVGMDMTSSNRLKHYKSAQKTSQMSLPSYESATEKRIEDMLLSHNRYHVYCE